MVTNLKVSHTKRSIDPGCLRTFERGGVGSVTGNGSLSVDLPNHLSVHGLNSVPPQDLGAPSGGEHEPDGEEGLEQEVEGCVETYVRSRPAMKYQRHSRM